MKTVMNNKKRFLTVATLMVLSTQAFAQEISLPVISKPAVLEEGTQRELTIAQINELLPWAKDSKVFLQDLLENVQSLNMADRVDRLVDGISAVVGESAPKHSELLMRYVLNRGLVINQILSSESDASSVGIVDAKYRVLRQSIVMAIKYYDTDMKTLSQKTPAPFVTFGKDYYLFLAELNKSVFDASAQYKIQKTAMEFLQWDLYRDLNNTAYASQIVKINNALKSFPSKKLTDNQSIALVRQMKSVMSQLTINEVSLGSQKSEQQQSSVTFGSPQNRVEFNTLIAKKNICKTIDEGKSYAAQAMSYISSIDDFFTAIAPGIANPSSDYLRALGEVGFEHRMKLINHPDVRVEHINKLNKITDNVSYIIKISEDFIPKLKTAEDFLALTEYTVASPSSLYRDELRAMVLRQMNNFMKLNPNQRQIEQLQNRVR